MKSVWHYVNDKCKNELIGKEYMEKDSDKDFLEYNFRLDEHRNGYFWLNTYLVNSVK